MDIFWVNSSGHFLMVTTNSVNTVGHLMMGVWRGSPCYVKQTLSTSIHQKCPREFTHFVHENSPFMSTRILPSIRTVLFSRYCNNCQLLIKEGTVNFGNFYLSIHISLIWKKTKVIF